MDMTRITIALLLCVLIAVSGCIDSSGMNSEVPEEDPEITTDINISAAEPATEDEGTATIAAVTGNEIQVNGSIEAASGGHTVVVNSTDYDADGTLHVTVATERTDQVGVSALMEYTYNLTISVNTESVDRIVVTHDGYNGEYESASEEI